MRKHVIFYFSGTGNSLKAALSIQKALGNADVVSMGTRMDAKFELPSDVESVGFVFPCYFGGVPHQVQEFVLHLNIPHQETLYVYAVITYGAVVGATVGQFAGLLQSHRVTLDYAATLKSFSNYVVMYDMSEKVAERTAQSKTALQSIIADIAQQTSIEIKKPFALAIAYNRMGSKDVLSEDRNFVVNERCTRCGLCEQVCPVRDIELKEGRPQWLGHCEQCLACLQWCPERAIDYGTKTKKRGRYTHPEITLKMFVAYLNGTGISSSDG